MIPIDAIREAAARTGALLHRTPVFSSRTLGGGAFQWLIAGSAVWTA